MENSGIISWCNRFIRWGFIALFGLIPLLLTPWNYELFEYNKMMAVYAIASFVVASWVVKSIAQKEFRIARTPLDIPILFFFLSQLLSSLFSIDPHVSWFGYYSRFNGGMWSVISYVLLFYAYLSNKTDTSNWTHLLKTGLVTAALVALYGFLERLGIDKHIWVQDVQNRVFSTLGQPNWLAAYLVALLPLPMAFFVNGMHTARQNKSHRIWEFVYGMWGFTTLLFFIVLLFTRSRSGLLGFVVADIIFWGIILATSLRSLKKPIIILHAVFALIIFINGTGVEKVDRYISLKGLMQQQVATQSATPVAAPALEVGGTESGTIRKYVWQGAVNAWNSSWKTRFIGTGTETFAFAFYKHRPVGHNNTSEWDFLYNKAHNEYLNYLATTGVLGLGSYLLFIGAFIYWFIKFSIFNVKFSMKHEKFEMKILSLALFAGWLSILVTNFFGFSVVTQQLFLFLFPALIFSRYTTYDVRFPIRLPSWVVWLPVIGGLYVVVRIGSFWYADTLYAKGYRLVRGGLYGQAIPALDAAIGINPKEPLYHDEVAGGYAALAVAAFEEKNATQAAQLATLAIEESGRAITTSARNVNFYKTRTKVYYTLSALDPTFNAKAAEALGAAIPLSPNDPKIYYNIAILVGRDGESDKAIEYLNKAKDLKSNYRDAYYALWVFYTEAKNTREARAILEEYLTNVDPNDKDFLERLK